MSAIGRDRGGRQRARWSVIAGAVALLLVAGACSGDGDDAGDSGGGSGQDADGGGGDADTSYEITSFTYDDITVEAGSTLEVTNSSGGEHTFTADDGEAFDEPVQAGGNALVEVPTEPGEYGFHCEIHPSMQATLTVG